MTFTNSNNSSNQQSKLMEGEEILWSRVLSKGFFRKKVTEVLAVTNKRVVKESGGYLFNLLLSEIDDVQVLNQHRSSNMAMTGTGVRSGNMRYSQYAGQSRSKTIGDVLLMSKDHQDFAFTGIQDPKGLADMIKTIMEEIVMMKRNHNLEEIHNLTN